MQNSVIIYKIQQINLYNLVKYAQITYQPVDPQIALSNFTKLLVNHNRIHFFLSPVKSFLYDKRPVCSYSLADKAAPCTVIEPK